MADNNTEDRRLRDRFRRALDEIIQERDYQRQRWDIDHDENHTPSSWLTILTVYLGKASQCVFPYTYDENQSSRTQFRKRVTQLGAICAAILESMNIEDEEQKSGK